MQRAGVLFRGDEAESFVTAYRAKAKERGIPAETVFPERPNDPKLQAALFSRMMRLDFDAVIVRPAAPRNLVSWLQNSPLHRTVLDVGGVIDAALLGEVPNYHPIAVPAGAGAEQEAGLVFDALSALSSAAPERA